MTGDDRAGTRIARQRPVGTQHLAADFGAQAFGIGLVDDATRQIAVDFRQLIAIHAQIVSGGRFRRIGAAAPERPQNGDGDDKGQGGGKQPEHGGSFRLHPR